MLAGNKGSKDEIEAEVAYFLQRLKRMLIPKIGEGIGKPALLVTYPSTLSVGQVGNTYKKPKYMHISTQQLQVCKFKLRKQSKTDISLGHDFWI